MKHTLLYFTKYVGNKHGLFSISPITDLAEKISFYIANKN